MMWFYRLQQVGQMKLWKYADDTPVEKLHRHYRIACWIGYIWLGSSGLMMSTLAEFLISKDGWLRTVSLIILLLSGAVALLSSIPGICAGAWASEIERTLVERGQPLPPDTSFKYRVPRLVMKMLLWFVVAILIAHFASKKHGGHHSHAGTAIHTHQK